MPMTAAAPAKPVIAIDGHAASGKGTLARTLAKKMDYAWLDTGALYRAVAYKLLESGGDPCDEDAATLAAQELRGSLTPADLDNPVLRSDTVGEGASRVATYPGVRAALLQFQKDFAFHPPESAKGAVLDGRDIGTVICPQAPLKLFVTAAREIRAERRFKELQSRGLEATYEAVLEEMRTRDARDEGRAEAPLKPAPDAKVIDTSSMTADQVLDAALSYIRATLL